MLNIEVDVLISDVEQKAYIEIYTIDHFLPCENKFVLTYTIELPINYNGKYELSDPFFNTLLFAEIFNTLHSLYPTAGITAHYPNNPTASIEIEHYACATFRPYLKAQFMFVLKIKSLEV